MKIFNNKSGQMAGSTGFRWIKFLLLIFVLGFLFITVSYAYNTYVKGSIDSLINDNTLVNASVKAESLAVGTKIGAFFDATPVIIIITLIIGLILGAVAISSREQ